MALFENQSSSHSKYPWLFEASSGEYLTKILSTLCKADAGLHPGQHLFFVSGVPVGTFTVEPGKQKERGIKSEEGLERSQGRQFLEPFVLGNSWCGTGFYSCR